MTALFARDVPELREALNRSRTFPEVIRLKVTCPDDHTLIRVLETSRGIAILYQTTGLKINEHDYGFESTGTVPREAWCVLFRSDDDPHGSGQVETSCRCMSGRLDTASIWEVVDDPDRARRARVRRNESVLRLLEVNN